MGLVENVAGNACLAFHALIRMATRLCFFVFSTSQSTFLYIEIPKQKQLSVCVL